MPASFTDKWQQEQAVREEATNLAPEGLTAFLARLTDLYRGAFWPKETVLALLHNTRLPLDRLVPSSASPAFYKSLLHVLEDAAAPIDASGETRDIGELMRLVIDDPLFPTVDDALFRSAVKTVSSNSSLGGLEEARAALLVACGPARFSLLPTSFLERIAQDALPEAKAAVALDNLTRANAYPFLDQFRFLATLLCQAGKGRMHAFLLERLQTFIPSSYNREKLLFQLAERAPYDFPVLFYKRQSRLTAGISTRYSQDMKHVRRLCWQRLTLGQRLLSTVPFLL